MTDESRKVYASSMLSGKTHPLRRHQAISISDEDWDHGCERLIQALLDVLGPARKRSSAATRWGLVVAVAALLALSLVLVSKWRSADGPAPTPTLTTQTLFPETTRAVAGYDKSVAKSYNNAADVMS